MTPIVEEGVSSYLVEFNAAIDAAILQGFTVVRGDSRTLLLDLDTAEDIAHFQRMQGALTFLKLKVKDRWPSKSGKGEHVVISVERDLTAVERVLMQACLGSDRLHELLSLTTGIWEGNAEPTVLFRPPVKVLA